MQDDRLTPCEADLARIGYRGQPNPVPRPAKVVEVVVVFDSGASLTYPADRPTRLTGPIKRVEFISGKCFIRD